MKKTLLFIITTVLLFHGPLFSQIHKSLTKGVQSASIGVQSASIGAIQAATGDAISRSFTGTIGQATPHLVAPFIFDANVINNGALSDIHPFRSVTLQDIESFKKTAIDVSRVINPTFDNRLQNASDASVTKLTRFEQGHIIASPLSENLSDWDPPTSPINDSEPISLGFTNPSLVRHDGLHEIKNLIKHIQQNGFDGNTYDCKEDHFVHPSISPGAITVLSTKQDYLVNGKPTKNPSNDIVQALNQKNTSTFVEIYFENTNDYSSILDLDKIEQNTNLDIQNCIASYYQNGSVLVQIPILSKSLLKTSFWEKLKRLFKKDKGNIEKEFKEIHYLENNIKTLHHDYILEDAAAA